MRTSRPTGPVNYSDYPTRWPYKGRVVKSDSNAVKGRAFLQALTEVIEFWEGENIEGDPRFKLNMLKARIVRDKAHKLYSGSSLSYKAKYAPVKDLADSLDALSPEGSYFGALKFTTDDYGFWNADLLHQPFLNFR